ncbi:MAG: TonB-dependent receptor [Ignavibacteria bacterium]|nr:TonB-dependent receptor [Ignavibacteria bacterium]
MSTKKNFTTPFYSISLIIILLLSTLLNAGTTGKLTGKIKDAQTGELLVGANIIIEGTALGSATNVNGEYVILNIPPGRYNVKFSYIGYESVSVNNVVISVDQTTQLSVELSSQSLQLGEIFVTATKPLVQKDVTSSIAVISREEIEALPVSTFTDLLSLQAGVVGNGSNLHIRGGRSNEVAYMIDGMLAVDPLLGGLATSVNNDAIQELSLLSGTFNAEYGNALSGIVNIVTRDGSENISAKVEYRTSEFGVKRYSDLHESRINGSISGPIFVNNLKFFISAEQDKRGNYLPFGYNNDRSLFTKITSTQIPMMKISLSNRGSLGRRQSYSHSYKYIPEQYTRRRTDSWHSSLTMTHTVMNNLFYDLRVSYFNQGYYSGIDKDTSRYLSTSQRTYFPIGTGFEFYSNADPVQLDDSRTITFDVKADAVWQFDNRNEAKFGIAYKKHRLKYYSVYDPKRNYPYINDYTTEPYEIAGYIQDKIELPYLVINLGLRYDFMNANNEYRNNPLDPTSFVKAKSRSQISPRIGIAHPISDRTKLHFSYGHFFQNPDFQFLFENNQYDINVREPLFGQPNLDAQRTISYEVGLGHQLNDRTAINLTAYYRDITGLIGTRYYFPFVDGRFVGYTLYVNEDYANVKGFELSLDMRPDQYFSGGLSYTYSIAKGSASSETEQYPGTQESTQLYYLDFDRTHMLNASGTYTIPKDEGPSLFNMRPFEQMDFSMIFRLNSGAPYTPGGRDVGFVERNSLRQPATYSLDLMIGKDFTLTDGVRLRVFAEFLNLTDHRNILYVYRDTGEVDFTFEGNQSTEYMQDPSNYGPPRSIRIGTTFRFR